MASEPNRAVMQRRHGSEVVSRESETEVMEQIYSFVRNVGDGYVSFIGKICFVVAILVILVVVLYICYTLSHIQPHLRAIISPENTTESLEALRELSVQSVSTIYNIVFGFLLVAMLLGFGCVLLYLIAHISGYRRIVEVAMLATKVDSEAKERDKESQLRATTGEVNRLEKRIEEHKEKEARNEKEMKQLNKEKADKAEKVAELQATERAAKAMAELQEKKIDNLKAEKQTAILDLRKDISERDQKLKEQTEKGMRDEKKIDRLNQEKAQKVAELAAKNEDLQRTKERLEEVEERGRELKEDLREKERSNAELSQNLSANKARVTRLESDLSREKSEASSLRVRAQNVEERSRSRIQRLEADNKQLQTVKARQEEVRSRSVFGRVWAAATGSW